MKKIIVIAMLLVSMMSFAQITTTKNELMAGADFTWGSYNPLGGEWSYVAEDNYMSFTIPGVEYQFEAKPNDMFKLFLHADAGYLMSKYTDDGDAPANGDCFASAMYFALEPMVKAYLPNNLFVKIGLPFGFMNLTKQDEDADAESGQKLDMWANFGFDNREIEMHGLTPWDKFEKGMAFYGKFEMGILETWEDEDTEEFQMYLGVEGCYAYYMENMMVKPYLKYKMQLNEGSDTEPLQKDSSIDIGAVFAKDFSEQFNLEAGLDFGIKMLEEENTAGDDMLNSLN
ncbi:MAG: hypothetical protein KKD38_08700, partial [Candidatus Delongbacteria bacterium]|nr:hypothetical protein [Candidatus Delongbacteria bacterium]